MTDTAPVTLTEQHRAAQANVRARTLRDFLVLWPLWTGDQQSFGRLVTATMPLIRVYQQMSATVAASYYQALRDAEHIAGDPTVRVAAPIVPKQIAASLYVTGDTMTRNALQAGQSATEARRAALTRVSGAVTRHVLDGGRDTILNSVDADKQALGWARVTDGNPCYFCLALASRGAVYKSEQTADFAAHDHCVPGGTAVSGPSVELGFRRWYEGEVIVVHVASGDELSITPNHPVLTERGWVEAGLLREGDHVFRRFGADLHALRVPHEDEIPTLIEDVWGAPRMDPLRTMPVAAKDFHGDGRGSKGNVEVVTPHRLFPHIPDATAVELGDEEIHPGTRPSPVADPLTGCCDAHLVLLGVASAAALRAGDRGNPTALLGGHSRHHSRGGFARPSPLDVEFLKPPTDGRTRDAVAFGERLLGLSRGVALADAGRDRESVPGWPPALGPRFNTPPTESEAERIRMHAQLGGDLAERLSGGVESSRVVHLRRVEWTGHVYNLQTVEGWYEANGIIVSNCGCAAMPVYKGSTIPGFREWRRIYNEAQNHGEASGLLQPGENSSKARLNAVRRHLATNPIGG